MAEVSSQASLPNQGTARRAFGAATAGAPPRQGNAPPSSPSAPASRQSAGPPTSRSAYQQRMDEIKVRIVDLSHRNMENALRIMRVWMNES